MPFIGKLRNSKGGFNPSTRSGQAGRMEGWKKGKQEEGE